MDKIIPTRSAELKFIKDVITPINPKDLYHQNIDDALRMYYGVIFVGMLMIVYMLMS